MYDLEEQEQIDALKGWWNQHGRTVMAAAVAAILAAGATFGWREYQRSQSEKASALFGASGAGVASPRPEAGARVGDSSNG